MEIPWCSHVMQSEIAVVATESNFLLIFTINGALEKKYISNQWSNKKTP